MKIAIIGASGQLGADLVARVQEQNVDSFVALTHADCDITTAGAISTLSAHNPDIIVNLAAYHAVDNCEMNPQKAYEVNVFAVKRLVDFCRATNTTLVQLSTDYVFGKDTKRRTPYTEADLPAPISLYGLSRMASEYMVENHLKKFFLIRTSGLFGKAKSSMNAGGNFVELMIAKAKRGEPIRVVNDQTTAPTYTKLLAHDIYALIGTHHYGLYHMVSQGSCTWFTFAKEIFAQVGLSPDISTITTKKLATAAVRPAYSVLDCTKIKSLGLYTLPHWKAGLREYLVDTGRKVL